VVVEDATRKKKIKEKEKMEIRKKKIGPYGAIIVLLS